MRRNVTNKHFIEYIWSSGACVHENEIEMMILYQRREMTRKYSLVFKPGLSTEAQVESVWYICSYRLGHCKQWTYIGAWCIFVLLHIHLTQSSKLLCLNNAHRTTSPETNKKLCAYFVEYNWWRRNYSYACCAMPWWPMRTHAFKAAAWLNLSKGSSILPVVQWILHLLLTGTS